MSFGISPPGFTSDRIPFNFYAMSCEAKEEKLRQVASEIRRLPNPNDTEAQNEICVEVTGRTLDELSQEEFDFISKCVNRIYL